MNEYQEQYESHKAQVLDFLDKSIETLGAQERADLSEPLATLRANVANGFFSIVMVGEFSAGKSTFLNALMHRRILPSFTSETTATVNFLRDKSLAPDGVAGIVYYSDDRTAILKDLDLKTIEQVVSTRGDTDEQKVATSIDHVDLFLESDFLKDGVMLVDSPGLNGVADNHREITQRQVKASNACIFLFSADHPGSKTDFDYLHELKSQSNNIFFVLNKINVIKKEEGQTVEEVIESLRKTYSSQFPDEKTIPKIWPVAANAALVARDPNMSEYQLGEIVTTQERRDQLEQSSRMGDFEERLWQYLTQGERTHDQLCGPVDSALKNLASEKQNLESNIKTLSEHTSTEELNNQREQLEKEIQKIENDRNGRTASLRKGVNTALQNLMESAGGKLERFRSKVDNELKNFERYDDIVDYYGKLSNALPRKYQSIAADLDDELRNELLNVVGEEYEKYMEEMEDKIAEVSGQNVFQFSGKEHILSDISLGIDLERFEAECSKLREKIASLEASATQYEDDLFRAKRIEREIAEKKDALRYMQDSMRDYKNNYIIPAIRYRTEKVEEERERHGALKRVWSWLFGGRIVEREKEVADSTERDAALRERDEYLAEMEQEKRALQADLSEANKLQPRESSDLLQTKLKRTERELERKEEELKEMQEGFRQEAKEKSERACGRLRNEIMNKLEDDSETASQAIKKYLQAQKAGYIRTAQDILNVSLNQELERAKKKLDDLIQQIDAGGKERDRALEQNKKRLEHINGLIEEGSKLYGMLDSVMKDHIEEEEL